MDKTNRVTMRARNLAKFLENVINISGKVPDRRESESEGC